MRKIDIQRQDTMNGIRYGSKEFEMNKNTKNMLNYVFIEGEGTWFFSKEDANKGHYKTGNEVGLHIKEKVIGGITREITVYRQCSTNVWD